MAIVKLNDVSVRYGKKIVLYDITFNFDGGVLVIIGPNGAGKTTLLNVINGLIKPFSGVCMVFDKNCESIGYNGDNRIVYILEKPPSSLKMRIRDIYDSIISYRKCDWDRFLNFMEILKLNKERMLESTFKRMSAGERMKSYIALSLSIDAKLYILDEPNSNIDPDSRPLLATILNNLKNEHKNIIVSTHLYEYIEDLADQILMLNKGRMIIHGSFNELESKFLKDSCIIKVHRDYINVLLNLLKDHDIEIKILSENMILIRKCDDNILHTILTSGIKIYGIEMHGLKMLYETLLKEA